MHGSNQIVETLDRIGHGIVGSLNSLDHWFAGIARSLIHWNFLITSQTRKRQSHWFQNFYQFSPESANFPITQSLHLPFMILA